MSKPRISHDENYVFVDLRGEGWKVSYAFRLSELEAGASLSRMMTLKNRVTLHKGSMIIPTQELRDVAAAAVPYIREVTEDLLSPRR